MTTIDTLIVGGGQAGLALSRGLTALGRDHLVLERGRMAQRAMGIAASAHTQLDDPLTRLDL